MRFNIVVAAMLAAVFGTATVTVQEVTQRKIFKSITVGSKEGKALTCNDITRQTVRPKGKYYGWTEDSRLTEKPRMRRPRRPRLPESQDPEVTFGKVPSRNEFGISQGWFYSPDSTSLAVYRVDESQVGSFPLLDIKSRTGSLKSIKYPMNGMSSERVSLCVCDTLGNIRCTLAVSDYTDERYLAGVSWTPDSRYLLVQVIDRSQHELKMNLYDALDGSFVRTLLEERNDAWVEPRSGVDFIKGTNLFLYNTDNRDGYRQLYLCDLDGGIRRLTQCDANVSYVADDGDWVYYYSAEVSPVENHLFRVRLGNLKSAVKAQDLSKIKIGKPQRLTKESGSHRCVLSPDCKHFIDSWSTVYIPGRIMLKRADGKLEEDLYTAVDPMKEYSPTVKVEMGTVPSADPAYLNYYRLVRPANFDPSGKYPLIVYVYGGPHSQMVRDTWLAGIRYWELLMAQKGYVVYIQDNRGTDNRGADFEKAINRQCGVAETADQMNGIKQLILEGWVDTERIGVCGWSYGGFMTITMATRHPDVFKVAAAGGPVIDWKWYEVMYGERYMDTPKTNPEGFALTSLVDKAPSLKARLLVCQGMEDGTVLPINSLSFMQSCVENNVLADYFPYPRSEHNVTGKWREQLYLKWTDYFETYL